MLTYVDGVLQLDGRDAEQLAATVGTPCFVLSERRLRDNYQALAAGLARGLSPAAPANVRAVIRYCAKTNPDPRVLTVLRDCGSELLVSHAAEAERARSAGFAAEKLAYQRPVLERAELERALAVGVRHVHVYREQDVALLSAVAAAQRVRLQVSMRVATHAPALRLSPLRVFADRLGVPAERALPCALAITKAAGLELVGLNFHAGTQLSRPEAHAPMLERLLAIAARIAATHGVRLRELNVGGGLPSPSLAMLSPLQRLRAAAPSAPSGDDPGRLAAFGEELARRYLSLWRRSGLEWLPNLVVEPGRALISNAVVMLTRVRAVQGRWLYLDSTRNYLPENFLMVRRALLPARAPRDGRTRVMHVSGSTLNSMDVLDVLRAVPAGLSDGDLLVWCDAGAYSLARATTYACEAPRMIVLDAPGLQRVSASEDARAMDYQAVASV